MENKFEYEYVPEIADLIKIIKAEEKDCVQQVAFSTFHTALTQINFTKKIIRSNIKI